MKKFLCSFGMLIMVVTLVVAQPSRNSSNKKKTAYSSVSGGYGWTMSNDLYHVYTNPEDGIASPSSGSAILNFGAGPKLWLGNNRASLSVEGQAVWGILALSSKENKGLGSLAVPLMAKLNFQGLSGAGGQGSIGYSIGAGIQYSKTELYGLKEEFAIKGVTREFFRTYIVQANFGFGVHGFATSGFVRYGFNPDEKSKVLSVGLQYDFNVPKLKEISNKESLLW